MNALMGSSESDVDVDVTTTVDTSTENEFDNFNAANSDFMGGDDDDGF